MSYSINIIFITWIWHWHDFRMFIKKNVFSQKWKSFIVFVVFQKNLLDTFFWKNCIYITSYIWAIWISSMKIILLLSIIRIWFDFVRCFFLFSFWMRQFTISHDIKQTFEQSYNLVKISWKNILSTVFFFFWFWSIALSNKWLTCRMKIFCIVHFVERRKNDWNNQSKNICNHVRDFIWKLNESCISCCAWYDAKFDRKNSRHSTWTVTKTTWVITKATWTVTKIW